MKYLAHSLLCSALYGASTAMPQLLPQGGLLGSLMPKMTDTIKFHDAKQMTPEFKQGAKRTVYRYGPLHLVGKNDPIPARGGMPSMDKHGESFRLMAEKGFCSNCTVLSGKVGLQWENGTEAESVYIHHLLVADPAKSSAAPISKCGSGAGFVSDTLSSTMRRLASGFIGRGDDNGRSAIYFTPSEGDIKSGYHIKGDGRMMMIADLVNYSEAPADVYAYADLEYVDGQVGSDAVTELMSVAGCDRNKGPNVSKAGPASTDSPKFPILQDGYIVSAKGHMHDGGDYMELFVNDKLVCTSHAEYFSEGESTTPGTIKGMTRCGNAIPVKKGDVVLLKSLYDLTKHPSRMDSHGGESHSGMNGSDYMGMWALTFTTTST